MPNTPVPAAARGLPADLEAQVDEFQCLSAQRRQIDCRLAELVDVLEPALAELRASTTCEEHARV